MWPRTRNGEKKHKQRKRALEIELILNSIRRLPEMDSKVTAENKVLEIGTGDGFQIPYLQTLGHVTSSDIYMSENIRRYHQSSFVKCSICEAPFASNTFDLIFSNHVIEHIEDLDRTFQELKRIGKVGCVYAFSVPTALWLLLSVPAHYYNILRWVLRKLFRRANSDTASLAGALEEQQLDTKANTKRTKKQLMVKMLRSVLPGGHGCYAGFFNCWRHFRVKAWKALFQNNGFRILRIEPLLLYAASEWPIVPTTRLPARYGWYSSVLFLMERVVERKEAGKFM